MYMLPSGAGASAVWRVQVGLGSRSAIAFEPRFAPRTGNCVDGSIGPNPPNTVVLRISKIHAAVRTHDERSGPVQPGVDCLRRPR